MLGTARAPLGVLGGTVPTPVRRCTAQTARLRLKQRLAGPTQSCVVQCITVQLIVDWLILALVHLQACDISNTWQCV